ncbi:hypothetical protein LU276_03960 [Moraxella haemolytica]|uniref:hypothetical protein n=1 Tax=Moraxella haemolytica TaxID=2904119 RepID=UPI002543882F|nr:hypothetical protein [Moraxella sp. ZY171148]WII95978.1 hypothetical protein LU276_03960 [Moraxella sp. ZY171148]
MPKVTNNPKSRNQTQYDSNAKRGVKTKGFILHLDDIALIEQMAKDRNIPQNQLIMDAIRAYEKI